MSFDQILDSIPAQAFLDRLTKTECSCGTSLEGQPIKYYPHSGGWKVPGFNTKLWLYITCPKCKYDWALWKLGVSRNE